MAITRMRILARAAALLLLTAHGALAQPKKASVDYPSKPVRLVVASAPGGGTDIIARMLGHGLNDAWGQQIVVDNRPGAGGTIATDIVAKAQPDGFTLLFQSLGISYASALYKKLPFDVKRDIAAVVLVATQPFVLTVNASVPATSVSELIQLAKTRPGQLRYGSGGVGGASHLGTELLRTAAHIDIVHIPYKGTGPGVTALLGNEIQMLIVGVATALPHARAGRIKLLALTGSKRSEIIPDLPTISESGLPGYEFDVWYGLYAPAKTPRAVLARINGDANRFLQQSAARRQFAAAGVEPLGGGVKEFEKYLLAEMAKWATVIREAGIHAN